MREALRKAYKPIEKDLLAMEALLDGEMTSEEPFLVEFLDHFSKYGGKRVRPALLFLFGRAFGEVKESHVCVAASSELIHMATLIHDDILDEASVRRQVKTPNTLWGNERSVLLGDWVFTKAFEIVCGLGDLRVVERLVSTSRAVCQGEMLQICHRHDLEVLENRYFDILRMKTGSLFAFCCEMGAFLSGARGQTLDACREYGENLGVAFQIIDDCLDVQGREESVGKTLGTDITKGKMTLPIIRALGTLPTEQRDRLARAFLGPDGREEVSRHVEEAGAVPYSRERAVQFTENAKRSLLAIDGSPIREQMEVLADFVVDRAW